jgi:hypothetical protein
MVQHQLVTAPGIKRVRNLSEETSRWCYQQELFLSLTGIIG